MTARAEVDEIRIRLWGPARPEHRCAVLCAPHAGAGASAFAPLRRMAPPHVRIAALQPPGRETRLREDPCRTVEELVEDLLPAVVSITHQPYALFGHSLGALTAFELVRSLRARGEVLPRCLFVSGRGAPHVRSDGIGLINQPDEVFVTMLRKLGGTPEVLLSDERMMKLIIPALRADLASHESYRYRYEEPLDVPVVAFAATEDDRASVADVEQWGLHTSREFHLRVHSGNHFAIVNDPSPLHDEIVREVGTWL